jgi:hypothetical protein
MTEVSGLERQLEDSKKLIHLRDQAIKLYDNPEFKSLIVKGFCTEDCARFAQESGDPTLSAEQRADALGMAQASGHLRRFLSTTVVMGNTAANQKEDLEAAIEEARQEAGE